MHMKKTLVRSTILSLLILVLAFIPACKRMRESDDTLNNKILFIMTDTNDTYRTNLTDAILECQKEFGASIDLVITDGDSDMERKLVSDAKKDGYNAIICRPRYNSNAPQLNSASNDIPIIYVNNQPAEEHLVSDKYIFVGSYEQQAGEFQAEYIISRLGTGAMNVAILQGEKDHSGTEGRTSAVKTTLWEHGINANYVFVDYANWSRDVAEKKFEAFVDSGTSVDAVFCNNDEMALGVLEVMKRHNMDYAKIPVAGVDATEAACRSIAAGEMAFTVLQDSTEQGRRAVQAAVLLGQGTSISTIDGASPDNKYIWVDFEPVSASNVNNFLD